MSEKPPLIPFEGYSRQKRSDPAEKPLTVPFEGYSRQRRLDPGTGRSLAESLQLQRGDAIKVIWYWPNREERYDLIYSPILSASTASLTAYYCRNSKISN